MKHNCVEANTEGDVAMFRLCACLAVLAAATLFSPVDRFVQNEDTSISDVFKNVDDNENVVLHEFKILDDGTEVECIITVETLDCSNGYIAQRLYRSDE